MKGFTSMILLLLAAYINPLFAQKGTVTGIVADSLSEESLLGVNLKAGSVHRLP